MICYSSVGQKLCVRCRNLCWMASSTTSMQVENEHVKLVASFLLPASVSSSVGGPCFNTALLASPTECYCTIMQENKTPVVHHPSIMEVQCMQTYMRTSDEVKTNPFEFPIDPCVRAVIPPIIQKKANWGKTITFIKFHERYFCLPL